MSGSYFDESPILDVVISHLRVPLSGLIVIVGPNSSGKTNLLRELHAAISGSERQLIVAREIRLKSAPSFTEYLEHLQQAGDIECIVEPGGAQRYRKKSHQYGTQSGHGGEWQQRDLEALYSQFERYVAQPLSKKLISHGFLGQLGLLQCSALFIEQRLGITTTAGMFDTHNQSPASALQALRLNMKAQARLTQEIKTVFRRGAWLDLSGGSICIRVTDEDYVPTTEEKCDPEIMKTYRTIDLEGEGVRSYVGICIALLLAQRPLCLIDEPEMCLHPPQARAIGRFIGNYGGQTSNCTMVATHSSHVLRGILETNPNVSVIRLTRRKRSFSAQQVSPDVLREATRKPLSRAEAILDGLFADGVTICESDGDRLVYEAALMTLDIPGLDVRFIPVGGTGGFRDCVKLYRALNVPVAIAADLDYLANSDLGDTLRTLGAKDSEVFDIEARVEACLDGIRAIKSDTSAASILEKLRALSKFDGVWDLKKETEYRYELRRLSNSLNPLSLLKTKGISGLPSELASEVGEILVQLKSHGLFLVPNGELESWVGYLMSDISKDNKSLWATEAARRIEDNGKEDKDIWEYVASLVAYISSKRT